MSWTQIAHVPGVQAPPALAPSCRLFLNFDDELQEDKDGLVAPVLPVIRMLDVLLGFILVSWSYVLFCKSPWASGSGKSPMLVIGRGAAE